MIDMNGLLRPCPLTRFKLGGKSERGKMFHILHQAGRAAFCTVGLSESGGPKYDIYIFSSSQDKFFVLKYLQNMEIWKAC